MIISEEYQDLLSFKTKEEKIEHDAQMISYRILSEIEKVCEERRIKKKDLAEMVGTSKSYITQLFTGAKSINTQIMAKFEEALDITFEIQLKLNEDSYSDFLSKQMSTQMLNKCLSTQRGTWYYYEKARNSNNIISNLETQSALTQKAA
jgi:transcriptional regulator with XRE-family HTH domain